METTYSTEKRKLNTGGWVIAEAILIVLAVIGLVAWIYQLNQGLVVTNMTNLVVWGLYITIFMFLVGLSAGGLIVASSGEVFGAKHLKPLAPIAIWLSFVCVGLAALSIIPDLGEPGRVWKIFTNAQWNSPFVWDLAIILIYLVLSGIYLWLHVRAAGGEAKAAKASAWVRGFAFVALPAAILVHSITAWIFGVQISRSYWHSALLAPFFISSALVSGLGLLILAALLARRLKVVHFKDELVTWLGGLLATFIAVDFFFLLAEMVTRIYPAAEGEVAPALVLLSGRLAPLFWTEVILGLLIPFVMLVIKDWRKLMPVVAVASALAVVGIFLKRFNLLMVAFNTPYETFPAGIQGAQFLPDQAGLSYAQVPSAGQYMASFPYSPALVEILIVIGLLAAGALVWLVGLQLIPFKRIQEKEA